MYTLETQELFQPRHRWQPKQKHLPIFLSCTSAASIRECCHTPFFETQWTLTSHSHLFLSTTLKLGTTRGFKRHCSADTPALTKDWVSLALKTISAKEELISSVSDQLLLSLKWQKICGYETMNLHILFTNCFNFFSDEMSASKSGSMNFEGHVEKRYSIYPHF